MARRSDNKAEALFGRKTFWPGSQIVTLLELLILINEVEVGLIISDL